MKLKIGFATPTEEIRAMTETTEKIDVTQETRKCLVQVQFPGRNMPLTYFNDRFDLKIGDLVFVDGKLSGQQGCVVDISYNFKIKLSDYKCVIGVADVTVRGEFHFAGNYFVSFNRSAMPYEKVITWFKALDTDEEDVVTGKDDHKFCLDDFKSWNMKSEILDRGHEYYLENRVRYLCLDGECGRAIVEGSEIYEVEFRCCDGIISELVCDCYCSGGCKHEAAALMQLREMLECIAAHYEQEYEASGYFAALFKPTFFAYVVDRKETGSLVI